MKVAAQLVPYDNRKDGIPAGVINPQIKAVKELFGLLSELNNDAGLIISFGEKGTLVADMLWANDSSQEKYVSMEMPKMEWGEERLTTFGDNKQAMVAKGTLKDDELIELIEKHPKNIVLINLFNKTETDVMCLVLAHCLIKFPDLKINLVMLQETGLDSTTKDPLSYFQSRREVFEHIYSGRLNIHFQQLELVFGMHHAFHFTKNHPDEKKPVLIYDIIRGEIIACEIRPGEDSTARDIIIALSNGNFQGKLGSLH